MNIHTITGGPFLTNAYIVTHLNDQQAVLIDTAPGMAQEIISKTNKLGVRISHLLNTHGHWDHIADNASIQRMTNCQIGVHPSDSQRLRDPLTSELTQQFNLEPSEPTIELTDGLIVSIGSLILHVIHTPGHTPGGICLYAPYHKVLFSGDSLFAGSIGRTDFPEGNYRQLIDSIIKKLIMLPDDVVVYPGHGPATTIAIEKAQNPFLLDFI